MQNQKKDGQKESLRKRCRFRLVQQLQDLHIQHKNASQFLMVTDKHSLKILSSTMRMNDLMELNVVSIEQLDSDRSRYPSQHAIYFLSPSEESITLLLKDFQSSKEAKYRYIHLFFLNHIGTDELNMIAQSSVLQERVLTLKEFNQDFICRYDNIFDIDHLGYDLKQLFQSKPNEFQLYSRIIGEKLSTAVLALEKYSTIDLMFNTAENGISMLIAQSLRSKIMSHFQQLKLEKSEQIDPKAGKITVIIFDRSLDILSPLIRDFYYQPMLFDLLDEFIENDIIQFTEVEDSTKKIVARSAQLNFNDDIFKRFRFKHIGEVMNAIGEEFNEFISTNSTAKIKLNQNQEELDFQKMSEIVRSMPQYKELLAKYKRHMKFIDECWELFEKKDLKMIGQLEQKCATGTETSGELIKVKYVFEQIINLLNGDILEDKDKIRLAIIAILTLDLKAEQRQQLYDSLCPEGQTVIDNLVYLGVNPKARSSEMKRKEKKNLAKEAKKKQKYKQLQSTYNLSRTTSAIENILENLIKDSKNGNNFQIPPNFKSYQINSSDGSDSNKKYQAESLMKGNANKLLMGEDMNQSIMIAEEGDDFKTSDSKLIIFAAGGISFTELRALRNLADQESVKFLTFIGATSLYSPNQYINSLQTIKEHNNNFF